MLDFGGIELWFVLGPLLGLGNRHLSLQGKSFLTGIKLIMLRMASNSRCISLYLLNALREGDASILIYPELAIKPSSSRMLGRPATSWLCCCLYLTSFYST